MNVRRLDHYLKKGYSAYLRENPSLCKSVIKKERNERAFGLVVSGFLTSLEVLVQTTPKGEEGV